MTVSFYLCVREEAVKNVWTYMQLHRAQRPECALRNALWGNFITMQTPQHVLTQMYMVTPSHTGRPVAQSLSIV